MRKGRKEAGRGRGREARSDRRGDMRRYGAGPTVSTTTTTTEDPQESLNEVRPPRHSPQLPLSVLSFLFPFLLFFFFLCVLQTGPLPCYFCKHLFLGCFEGFLSWDQLRVLAQDVFWSLSCHVYLNSLPENGQLC